MIKISVFRILAFSVFIVVFSLLSNDSLAFNPEDEALREHAQTRSLDITTRGMAFVIPSISVPNFVMDFDELPAGPTTIEDILSQFPYAPLTALSFITDPGTSQYNFQTGGGRALAPNPDESGDLFLVDPNGTYGEANVLIIELTHAISEFGFEVGDWGGPFNAHLYNGADMVGSVTVLSFDNERLHFIGSTDPFDRIELTADPQNPRANWVIPALILPADSFTIPTMSEWGAMGLALILGIFSVIAFRRKKTACLSIFAIICFATVYSNTIDSAIAETTPTRTLTFVNNCTDDIWVAAAGNTGACTPSNDGACANPPSCTSSNDCPINEYCVSTLHQSVTTNSCATNENTMCTTDSDCASGQFCNTHTNTCWQEITNFCNQETTNNGGCPPGVNKPGANTDAACSDSEPCPSGQTCNAATNTCWTIGPPGCGCDTTLPTPSCSFRQCTYVPVNGTNIDSMDMCTSNQDCGTEVMPPVSCSPTNECASNQYCNGTTDTCHWVGGEVTTPMTTMCTTNSDCTEPLEYCNPTTNTCWAEQYCNSSTNTCFFVATDGNGWKLDAQSGGTAGMSMVDIPVTWAGRFWGRTNCETNGSGQFLCDTGQCTGMTADSSGNAEFSLNCEVSGNPPVTAAEFAMGITFSNGNVTDFYDISMTDSANLAVSIVPDPMTYDMSMNGGIATTGGTDQMGSCTTNADCPTTAANGPTSIASTFNFKCDTMLGKCVNTYQCASPGCVDPTGCDAEGINTTNIECCPWDQASCGTGTTNGFAVSEANCSANVFGTDVTSMTWNCDDSGACGNAGNTPSNSSYEGCLGADQACVLGGNPTDLNCTGQPKCQQDSDCVSTPDMAGRCQSGVCTSSMTTAMTQLYGCTGAANQGATSCYSMPTADTEINFDFCCGCAAWSPINNNGKSTCAEIPNHMPTTIFSNPEWVNNSEPMVSAFHDACPQAYSFAFDDK
ncbi:MAG: IPTL-CTERM sorting domain-containing protein, partial [Thermodesulfobacteriota bacterium]